MNKIKIGTLGCKGKLPIKALTKSQDDARFERFADLLKNLCVQVPLNDAIKMPPYANYMKILLLTRERYPVRLLLVCLRRKVI
jgi:hypothetical protein